MNTTLNDERNINVDILKCFAVFFVISVHFFLNNGFYTTTVDCPQMYIMGIMRTFFMMCVPLFLLITGYLMNKKELSINYFLGLKNVLIPYTVISIVTLLGKIILSNYGVFHLLNFKRYLIDFIDFRLIGYAWYVDMYIGLFLLIPFINKIFTNKNSDMVLIGILLFLTVLPTVSQTPIFVVDYWKSLYPVTYYVIGAFISRYEINVSVKLLRRLFISVFLLFATIDLLLVNNSVWDLRDWDAWGGYQNIIISVLFFFDYVKS